METDGGRVMVTGGAGFIGAALARRLCAVGHEVVVVDSLLSGSRDRVPSDTSFLERDVRDIGPGAFEEVDTVYHLAAIPDATREDPELVDSIVAGTESVAEGAVAAGADLVYFSSALVYDGSEPPMRERDPIAPESAYARAKAAAEERVRDAAVPSAILRPANTVGPGLDRGIIPTFVEMARDGGPIEVWGSGDQQKCFVHRDDVVAAALTVPADGRVYNVGAPDPVSVNAVAGMVADRSGVGIEHVEKDVEPFRFELDCSRLRALGWEPSMDARAAVAATIKSLM